VLARIPPGRRTNIERETFPAMAGEGVLFGWADPAYWLDVGTPERLLQANLDVLDGRRAGLEVDEPVGAVVSDAAEVVASLLGDGATVAAGARVSRSALGAGVRIGPDAVVEGAVCLTGAEVGAGATVRRSILGVGASVDDRASVDELCVLGDGARVRAGDQLRGASVSEER
jgi:mannose-1-phosphate guanylyltransferase